MSSQRAEWGGEQKKRQFGLISRLSWSDKGEGVQKIKQLRWIHLWIVPWKIMLWRSCLSLDFFKFYLNLTEHTVSMLSGRWPSVRFVLFFLSLSFTSLLRLTAQPLTMKTARYHNTKCGISRQHCKYWIFHHESIENSDSVDYNS